MKKGLKQKNRIRVIGILLLAVFSLALLFGCTAPAGESSSALASSAEDVSQPVESEDTQVSSEGSEETDAPEPVTLTAFIDSPSVVDDWEWGDDYISQEITKRTGVTLEVTNATTEDHQELAVMLASGEELPDFILVNPTQSMPHMIISQGFAAPLNELADQYYPEFWDVLPTDMDTVHNWRDGNLYYVVSGFGDAERMDELKEPFSPFFSFMMNMDMYEEMGSPPAATLEELREVLKTAKETYDPDFTIFDGQIKRAEADANMAQAINRMMGGTDIYSIQEDGSVRLNFQDESYYKALKYINSLYMDGTFNPENFTVTSEQLKQILADQEMFSYFGHNWQILSGYEGGFSEDAPYRHADYPISADVDPEDVKMKNNYSSVSGNDALFITESSKHPDRAIQYISFLLSDEGQILQREGVEGLTYTLDEDGTPRPTELRLEYEAGPVEILRQELGMNNPKFVWLTSNWILGLARHLRIENEPYYAAQLDTARPYDSWERLNILAGTITDSDLLAIRTQIFDLWSNALPNLYLAKSDAEFEDAYNKLIADAKTLGLEELEKAFTDNYKLYYDRGVR